MNRAIFFDRDGVLNELVPRDGGYFSPQSKGQFVIIKNVNSIKKLLITLDSIKSQNYNHKKIDYIYRELLQLL